MHCIAKTLLTELHLAILVPLLCLRNFPLSLLLRFSPSLSFCRFPCSISFHFAYLPSLFYLLRDTARVYVCEELLHPPLEDPIRRRWWADGWGWWCEGVGGPMDGWWRRGDGFQESENGIPESLILLVNKCLGDSLLVHSYRPSFVSRRHCVLRFYLVFRSNGFWGPSRVASRVSRVTSFSPFSLSFLSCRHF